MESKDIIILVIGIIGSLIATILFNYTTGLNQINIIFTLIGLITIFILIVAYFLYRRIKESEERLDVQETEQKRLGEKLKIHEQLIDIKKDIGILKNGKKNRYK